MHETLIDWTQQDMGIWLAAASHWTYMLIGEASQRIHLAQRDQAENASKSNDKHETYVFAQVGLNNVCREDCWRILIQLSSIWSV